MQLVFIFVFFLTNFVLSSFACGSSCENSQGDTFRGLSYVGERVKKIDSKNSIHLKIYCSDWKDSWIECRLVSKNKMNRLDSFFVKSPSSVRDTVPEIRGYYTLTESVYDDNGLLMYSYEYRDGFKYSLKRFSHGRLVLFEKGCDTLQIGFKDKCLEEVALYDAEVDSMGRFAFSRELYSWDEKGRLSSRTLWTSNNGGTLDGTYVFSYGSPCDPIVVNPIDREVVFGEVSSKGRYHGSFGKMPEVGDPEYDEFAENPYSILKTKGTKLLVRQQKRCEDYKKSLKKGNGNHR